jgi:hypothetical protein
MSPTSEPMPADRHRQRAQAVVAGIAIVGATAMAAGLGGVGPGLYALVVGSLLIIAGMRVASRAASRDTARGDEAIDQTHDPARRSAFGFGLAALVIGSSAALIDLVGDGDADWLRFGGLALLAIGLVPFALGVRK